VHAVPRPCVYEKTPGAASGDLPRTYRQRQPQKSVLHRVVREHLLTFLADGVEKSQSDEGYPFYVEKEFRDYLSCADLSRGFARVRCGACGHEFLLPDGVFVLEEKDRFAFAALPPPEDVALLVLKIAKGQIT
jgi:hypothetical protein